MADKYTDIRASEYNTGDAFNTRLRSEGYNVGSLSYPDGLGVKADLQHYVTFFINVRGKSKFSYDINNKATPSTIAGSSRNTLDMGKNDTAATIYGGVVAAGALGLGATAIDAGAKLLGISSNAKAPVKTPAQQAIGATGKLAVFGVGTYIAKEALKNTKVLETDKTGRLTDVITLHMQERPTVTYGVNYQDKDLGILGGFLGADTAASEGMQAERQSGMITSMAMQLAKIPSILPGIGNPADLIQLGAKVKTNPFREVFFEGIDYRKFNFRYKFMPKSQSEVQSVYNIINKFKEHMHPEIAGGGAFFLYPSEFEIAYYYNNKENGYFNKIATCALTDMSVEYGGEQFSSFANGAPTEINVVLSFRELELVTKETIRSKGY